MRRLWLFLALSSAALIVGALLSLFFRDFVREQVVVPVAYLFWVLRLVILSIPQFVFWGMIVIIAFGIAVWASQPVSSGYSPRIPYRPTVSVSRYSVWLRYASLMNSSGFASDNLSRDLVRLTVQTLAYQHSLTYDEVYSQLEHDDFGLPPELYAFMRRRGFQTEVHPESRFSELIHRLFPRQQALRPPGDYTPLEQEANLVISQIEKLLSQIELFPIEPNPDEAAQ
jgi:hypothetical protein